MTGTSGEIAQAGAWQTHEDPYAAGLRLKGTWDDPAIVSDGRIDLEDPQVRAVAERLHGNESMHMHEHIGAVICAYCALRTSRVLRWAAEVSASSAVVDQ